MKPIVNGLEGEYEDRVMFKQLDAVNEGRTAFHAFELRGHPSFVIIDTAGEVLWKSLGQQDRSHLEAALRQTLSED